MRFRVDRIVLCLSDDVPTRSCLTRSGLLIFSVSRVYSMVMISSVLRLMSEVICYFFEV